MSDRINAALDKLKNQEVRMTPQRRAILVYLLNTTSHPSADDIYRALVDKFPNISVATVYNNLRMFKEANLVKELTYGDSSSRFDGNVEEHYHIICEECNKIVDFDYPKLDQIEEIAAEKTGFSVREHRMEVYGLCKECMSESYVNV